MSSESQVKNIMECIDEGLKELDDLEEKLERYDRLLQVREVSEYNIEYKYRLYLKRSHLFVLIESIVLSLWDSTIFIIGYN